MNLSEAAIEYWATLDDVAAAAPVVRRHEKACETLKKGMAADGLELYKGIELVTAPGGDRLDLKLAEAKFGSGLDDCRVPSLRRSLLPKRRPRRKTAKPS